MSQDQGTSPPRETANSDGVDFRNYGSRIEQIASDWYANPIQSVDVIQRGGYSQTADGACEVEICRFNAIAFAKPRPEKASPALVGREKVASDLGHILGLPIAPTVVRPPSSGWPNFTVMSLQCLPTGRLWSTGGDANVRRLAPLLESLRVFWTWLGDTDHNGHGQNLSWSVGSDRAAVSGFDHAYCLGHDGADPSTIPCSQGYGTATLPEAVHALNATIERIEHLSWPAITMIVERLNPVLTDEERERILRVLEVRRGELRRLLK